MALGFQPFKDLFSPRYRWHTQPQSTLLCPSSRTRIVFSPSTDLAPSLPQNEAGASVPSFWGRRPRRVLEARENTTRSHSRKPGVRDTKRALQQARSMVHGNEPATREGFETGRIPEPLCSRDRHVFHPRSFRAFSHEYLLYLSQRLKFFYFDIFRRKKTIMPGSRRLSSFAPAYEI